MAPEPITQGARRAPCSRPPRRRWRLALVIGAVLVVAGASAFGAVSPPDAAEAVVTPASGFRATVLGWSSWYGSYRMGSLGSAWCIDHGLHAPDPDFRYVATTASDLDADTAAAISWIVTAHGDADPVEAAGVMLAVHDLRHASYPFGVIDVERLTAHDLAGFGGHESEVLDRARALRAEARSHASLRAPFHLALTLSPGGEPAGIGARPAGGGSRPSARDVDGRATVRLTDAGGRPVVGAGLALDARGAAISGAAGGATGADGTFQSTYRLDPGPLGAEATVVAHAIVPAPVPAAYASSTVRAQRVVRGSWLGLDASATTRPPPTTTSTTSTTSTSTSTSTTTTSRPPTPRPTIPPTSTSTTVHPRRPTSTTMAPAPPPTIPAPTASSDAPPTSTSSSTPTSATLPRTGSRTAGWALIGGGLVLLGATLVALSRGWTA